MLDYIDITLFCKKIFVVDEGFKAISQSRGYRIRIPPIKDIRLPSNLCGYPKIAVQIQLNMEELPLEYKMERVCMNYFLIHI